MPIQPNGAKGTQGQVELKEDFVPGLAGFEGFLHKILVCYFHKSTGFELLT